MPPAAPRGAWWKTRASRSRRWSASTPRDVVFTSGGTEANMLALSPALGETLLVSAIEHPSVRSGGRFAAARRHSGDGGGRRRSRGAEAPARGPLAAAGLAHARQQRDRRDPAGRGGRRARACGGRAAACRRGAGPGPDCLRFQGARRRSDDAVVAQDRRAAGRRRADQARRSGARCRRSRAAARSAARGPAPRMWPASPASARPPRPPGWAGRRRPPGWRRCATSSRPGSRPSRPEAVIFGAEAARLPNTTLFSVPGMKAETAVIAFDLEGVAVSSGAGLFVRKGRAVARSGGHGGALRRSPAAQSG